MGKRLLDIFGSLCGLLLLSPLLACIAIWIKLDSPGPVFFRQERVGRYGKTFRIHKFRSMLDKADSKGPQLTTWEDSRITRSGHFLRKYKLDELAQLIDVLKGDMSLVGPRPEVPKYVAHYPAALKDIALSVKPGITDFASIEYRDENRILERADDPEKAYIEQVLPVKLKYHRKYAQEQSLWLDISLITKTVMLVFGRFVPDMLDRLGGMSRNKKKALMVSFDLLALPFAFWTALVLLEETFSPRLDFNWWVFPAIPIITIPIMVDMGLYRAVIRHMEDRTLTTVIKAVTLAVTLVFLVAVASGQFAGMHNTSLIIYWMIALLYVGGTRMLARSFYRRTRHAGRHKQRIIIYGAGEAGVQLASGLLAAGQKIPVAFIDDDPNLQGHFIGSLRVYPPEKLSMLIDEMHINQILLAIPSATPERRNEILANLETLHMNVLPTSGVSRLTTLARQK